MRAAATWTGRLSARAVRGLWPLVLLVVLVSPGCSTRKLAYSFADLFILREIDKAFDLAESQRAVLKPQIKGHMVWHRREELPRYVARLDELRARLGDGLSAEDARWTRGVIDELWDRIAVRLAPDAGAFLATVTPGQVDRLERRFAKRNRDRFEKYDLPRDRWVRDRGRELEKQAAKWLGPINDAQRGAIASFLQQGHGDAMGRRKAVLRQQREFAERLRRGGNADAWGAEMLGRMKDPERYWSDEERGVNQRVEARLIDLVLALDRAMTLEQRRHLDREIAAIRKDLAELAAE